MDEDGFLVNGFRDALFQDHKPLLDKARGKRLEADRLETEARKLMGQAERLRREAESVERAAKFRWEAAKVAKDEAGRGGLMRQRQREILWWLEVNGFDLLNLPAPVNGSRDQISAQCQRAVVKTEPFRLGHCGDSAQAFGRAWRGLLTAGLIAFGTGGESKVKG